MRLSAGLKAYNHGNRLGWLGYGVRPGGAAIGPSDARAFRDIKLSEIPGWLNGRPKDPIYFAFGIKRYFVAWRFKYGRPGINPMVEAVGTSGFPHNSQLTGTQIAQIIVGVVAFVQLVLCYKENRDHEFKKYHDYPLSETIMAYLPINYKPSDQGGKVAWTSFAFDAIVATGIVGALTASKGAPSAAMGAKRQQTGMMVLGAVGAWLALSSIASSKKGVEIAGDKAALATILNCEASEVDQIVAKNEQMNSGLRYSIFTNFFMRIVDAVTGLM